MEETLACCGTLVFRKIGKQELIRTQTLAKGVS
jgi:hypothetical protein